jgi:hypothetical protein
MKARERLFLFAAMVLALNLIATVVAIAVNWPSQFGQVGTDAAEEFLLAGTAISAPLLPVVLLVVVVLLARRPDALGWVAIVAAYLTALVVFIGAMGELVAEPTADTPKSVLTAAGVAWCLVGIMLALLATTAVVERRRTNGAPSPSAG